MITVMKKRDSNMELLRLVAMLLVMMIHASYRALPKPTMERVTDDPLSGFLQLLTEGFSIMAVDVFVMLSGWYGIRMRWSRLAELLFQLLFFGVVCLAFVSLLTGVVPQDAVKSVLLLNEDNYWFVKAYLALYLLSPVLNAFVETASRQQFAVTLTTLFAFQWVFGWVFEATSWLQSGYSLPSFMCLYLLARYLNRYRPAWTRLSWRADLGMYVAVGVLTAVTSFLLKYYFDRGGVLFFYNSPNVILAATCLLLFFSKLQFNSRVINWLAVSALAIYLTHSNSYLGKYYDANILRWYETENRGIFLVHVLLLMGGVLTGSVILDKLRLLVWKVVLRLYNAYKP